MLVGATSVRAHEVPIIAQEGEGILSAGMGMPTLAKWALKAMNQGLGPAGGATTIIVPVSVNGREIARATAPYVPADLKRRGL